MVLFCSHNSITLDSSNCSPLLLQKIHYFLQADRGPSVRPLGPQKPGEEGLQESVRSGGDRMLVTPQFGPNGHIKII